MSLVDFSEYIRFTSGLSSRLPEVQGVLKDSNVTDECRRAANSFLRDAKIRRPYTFKALDAYGHPESNLLGGNVMWMGSYSECTSIAGRDDFTPKYCLAHLTSLPPHKHNLWMGICLPEECDTRDSISYTNSLMKGLPVSPLYSDYAYCAEKIEFNAMAWFTLSVFLLFGVLCVSGTILDIVKRMSDPCNKMISSKTSNTNISNGSSATLVSMATADTKNNCNTFLFRFMLCYSWLSNGERLFDTKTRPGTLSCLNGIRFFSMTWIVLGHSISFIAMGSVSNIFDYFRAQNRIISQVIVEMTLAVDTFLVLSALLVTYLTITQIRRGTINWGYFYFHRFWRLSPVYWMVLLFGIGLFHYLVEGPHMRTLDATSTSCLEYGWTNLLYINNYYPEYNGQGCMGWTWYLAMDIQYYIVSPIFILLLVRKRRLGYAALILGVLIPVAITFGIAWAYGFYMYNPENISSGPAGEYIYFRGYCRFDPYVVGIFAGYLLSQGGGRVKMNKISVVLGWCVAILFGLAAVYGQSYYRYTGTQPPLAYSAIYVSTNRLLWALAMSWVIIACQSGYGGYIAKFLSWSPWGPLSRLTYTCYLIHPAVIFYYIGQLKTRFYFDNANAMYFTVGSLFFSLLITIGLVLSIEMPFLSLEKILFPCFTRKSVSKQMSPPAAQAEKYEVEQMEEQPARTVNSDMGHIQNTDTNI